MQLSSQLLATIPAGFQDNLQRARNKLEELKRQPGLASSRKRAIAPDDRSFLTATDPDTPLRRSMVRLWPSFSGQSSGIGPLPGTGIVGLRQGDRAWGPPPSATPKAA
ncbi:MAG: hypothetical protein ACK6BG_01415 [Cyanobacteriota bacterium]